MAQASHSQPVSNLPNKFYFNWLSYFKTYHAIEIPYTHAYSLYYLIDSQSANLYVI